MEEVTKPLQSSLWGEDLQPSSINNSLLLYHFTHNQNDLNYSKTTKFNRDDFMFQPLCTQDLPTPCRTRGARPLTSAACSTFGCTRSTFRSARWPWSCRECLGAISSQSLTWTLAWPSLPALKGCLWRTREWKAPTNTLWSTCGFKTNRHPKSSLWSWL